METAGLLVLVVPVQRLGLEEALHAFHHRADRLGLRRLERVLDGQREALRKERVALGGAVAAPAVSMMRRARH
jgi:hypothetical protein